MSSESSGSGGPDRLEYALLALGLLSAVITIGLGSYEKLWGTLDPQLRGSLTIACSISFTLGGFLSASYVQRGRLSKELRKAENHIIEEQRHTEKSIIEQQSHFAQVNVISVHSGAEGMEHITDLVLQAKIALNTIILPEAKGIRPDHHLMENWNAAVIRAVRAGTSFRDVASRACQEFVQKRASALSDKDYSASVLPSTIEAFLNFIVLKYPEGTKEVWFGWIRPSVTSFVEPCFRCRESGVVAIFETWHATLFDGGSQVRSA